MKKFRLLITCIAFIAVLLGACQAQEPAPALKSRCRRTGYGRSKEPFRVAVLCPARSMTWPSARACMMRW